MALDQLVQYARDECAVFRSCKNAPAKRVQPNKPPTAPSLGLSPALNPTKTTPPPTWYVSFVELADTGTSCAHSCVNQDYLLALTQGDETSFSTSTMTYTPTKMDELLTEQLLLIKRQNEDNRDRLTHYFKKPQRPRVQPPPVVGDPKSSPTRVG